MDALKEQKAIKEIISKIKDKFNLSDVEENFLLDINTELKKPIPSNSIGVQNKVNVLDSMRMSLVNFIYSINDKCSKVEYDYKSAYDPAFVRLTRAGRPNQQAVDSEIHIDQRMNELRTTLEQYESFKSLLFSYLKTLDSYKESCMKKWNQF